MFCLLARDNQHISLIPDFLPTENINIKTPSDQFTGLVLPSALSSAPLLSQSKSPWARLSGGRSPWPGSPRRPSWWSWRRGTGRERGEGPPCWERAVLEASCGLEAGARGWIDNSLLTCWLSGTSDWGPPGGLSPGPTEPRGSGDRWGGRRRQGPPGLQAGQLRSWSGDQWSPRCGSGKNPEKEITFQTKRK